MTPQAQVIYSRVKFDGFRDTHNVRVSLEKSESLEGRLGVALNREATFTSARGDRRRLLTYAIVNAYNEFAEGSKTRVAGVAIKSREERAWGGVAVGGTYNWRDDRFSVYGEVGARTSLKHFGDSHVFHGDVGFRISF